MRRDRLIAGVSNDSEQRITGTFIVIGGMNPDDIDRGFLTDVLEVGDRNTNRMAS